MATAGILPALLSKITKGKMKKPVGTSGSGHGLAGAGLHALRVPGFKKGGKVKKTGIYKLHAGETVVPANESPEQFRRRKLGHRY